jgi:CTP:molybdopterin cytidylyltransferase MocA
MIAAVVLAAGLSSRMGKLKATLPIDPHRPDGDTFLTRILRTFGSAGLSELVVVVGHKADTVVDSVTQRQLQPRFVLNPDYAAGQLSSLLCGLRAVDRPGVEAMLMTLVDVPLFQPATVRAVVDRYVATGAPIVRPVADDNGIKGAKHGHPVLIARALFPELSAADPSVGAKPIVRRHVSEAGSVEVDDPGAFLDIDTPADYERIFGRSE